MGSIFGAAPPLGQMIVELMMVGRKIDYRTSNRGKDRTNVGMKEDCV